MTNTPTVADNYYEIFEIATDADAAAIATSIRTARKRWRQLTGSPDRDRAHLAERRMAQLEAAEATLLDEAARAQYDAALSAGGTAAQAEPAASSSSTDWAERAKAYYEAGDTRNAFNAAKKGTDVDPDNNLTWYYYVQAAVDLKRFEDADFASAEFVLREPDLDVSHDLRGSVLDSMKRYKEAEVSFRNAARITPDSAYYQGRATWAVLDQGNVERAIEEAWELVQRFPSDSYPTRVLRAATEKLRELKRPKQALQVAQRLIAHQPGEDNILEAVLSIQDIEDDDVDLALAEAWRLLDAFPQNAAALRVLRYTIGGLRERNRGPQALAESRKLIARFPEDQEAKVQFARSRIGDAEDNMSSPTPDSHIILNKAQAAYYENAINEISALGVTDPTVRTSVDNMRQHHAQQTRTRVRLNFRKVLLAIVAIVFLQTGLSSMPSGLLSIIIAGLLGWWFYNLTFKKQYKLSHEDAPPQVRASGIQR